MQAIRRKLSQLRDDPTLRRWLLARAFGRTPGEPGFIAARPPYLADLLPLPICVPKPHQPFDRCNGNTVRGGIELQLPGHTLALEHEDLSTLFKRKFEDRETLLALHRFAWLPIHGRSIAPEWTAALWSAWVKTCATADDQWVWHPYTSAERAINILEFARQHGFPEPVDESLRVLAAHADSIAAHLEYFGDHHTSNHLANNGRGLFIIGLELGIPEAVEVGRRILLQEARRIFGPSGILREGSTHYHLLLTKNYLHVWLAARYHADPAEPEFRRIAGAALNVAPQLMLPGGLPRVGDISPDCPPAYLDGLATGEPTGWLDHLDQDQAAAVRSLTDEASVASDADAAIDGWHRIDHGHWSSLWHVSPEGWSHMPGHGHQDCGSFELHYGAHPVFVDLGRGTYSLTAEAAHDLSIHGHNGLSVDGLDPYPANRPYYAPSFRALVGGAPPSVNSGSDAIEIKHDGFSRTGSVGSHVRRAEFGQDRLVISDRLDGRGRHRIIRSFHTPMDVYEENDGLVLKGDEKSFLLRGDGQTSLMSAKRWLAYGAPAPATTVCLTVDADLPWRGAVTLEAR